MSEDIETGEVEKMEERLERWKAIQPATPSWLERIPAPSEPKAEPASPEDEALIDKCLEIMRQERKASTSLFQRRLRLGYTHAERLLSIMEERGHVGPGKGTTPREILIALPELSKTEPASPPPTWRVVRGGNFVDVVTVGYPAKKICAVTDYASAELIAAAPETARQRGELLSACNAFMAQMGNRTAKNCLGGLGAACDQARAAIARCQPAEKGEAAEPAWKGAA